jgi:hypothetical protein
MTTAKNPESDIIVNTAQYFGRFKKIITFSSHITFNCATKPRPPSIYIVTSEMINLPPLIRLPIAIGPIVRVYTESLAIVTPHVYRMPSIGVHASAAHIDWGDVAGVAEPERNVATVTPGTSCRVLSKVPLIEKTGVGVGVKMGGKDATVARMTVEK